jgi:hypothetical protein
VENFYFKVRTVVADAWTVDTTTGHADSIAALSIV